MNSQAAGFLIKGDARCPGVYVNDAAGTGKSTNVVAEEANDEDFLLHEENGSKVIFWVAKRRIKKGEELLGSYGDDYWKEEETDTKVCVIGRTHVSNCKVAADDESDSESHDDQEVADCQEGVPGDDIEDEIDLTGTQKNSEIDLTGTQKNSNSKRNTGKGKRTRGRKRKQQTGNLKTPVGKKRPSKNKAVKSDSDSASTTAGDDGQMGLSSKTDQAIDARYVGIARKAGLRLVSLMTSRAYDMHKSVARGGKTQTARGWGDEYWKVGEWKKYVKYNDSVARESRAAVRNTTNWGHSSTIAWVYPTSIEPKPIGWLLQCSDKEFHLFLVREGLAHVENYSRQRFIDEWAGGKPLSDKWYHLGFELAECHTSYITPPGNSTPLSTQRSVRQKDQGRRGATTRLSTRSVAKVTNPCPSHTQCHVYVHTA
jgi:hypothetical protein